MVRNFHFQKLYRLGQSSRLWPVRVNLLQVCFGTGNRFSFLKMFPHFVDNSVILSALHFILNLFLYLVVNKWELTWPNPFFSQSVRWRRSLRKSDWPLDLTSDILIDSHAYCIAVDAFLYYVNYSVVINFKGAVPLNTMIIFLLSTSFYPLPLSHLSLPPTANAVVNKWQFMWLQFHSLHWVVLLSWQPVWSHGWD